MTITFRHSFKVVATGIFGFFMILPWAFSQIPADTTSPGFLITKAVKKGNLADCMVLMASDSRLLHTVEPQNGESLLHVAARYNQPELVEWLIKNGLLVNQPNRNGNSPLHLAVFSGSYNLVKMLLDAGANDKALNQRGRTPIEYLSYGRNPLVYNLFLIRDSAVLKTKSTEGAGLLHWASVAGDTAGFSFLLTLGLNSHEEDFRGSNVVHWAYSGGDRTMLDYLKKRGLDYKLVSSKGFSPITVAMSQKNRDVIEYLIADGNDIDFRYPPENNTLFLEACNQNDQEMAELFAARGASINASDNNGYTALCWSLINHNLPLTQYLLSKGADPDHRVHGGRTPALLAVERGNLAEVELLAAAGADFSVTDTSGVGALQLAILDGNQEMVAFLLAHDADANTANHLRLTPLHYAAIFGQVEIGKALIASGAAVNPTDEAGLTPLCYSERYRQPGITALLRSDGGVAHHAMPCNDKTEERHVLPGEAFVHYLNHSGFVVETNRHFLVFDYFPASAISDSPSLANGKINLSEMRGKQIVVFVSHDHADHYDTTIRGWALADPGLRYVAGFNVERQPGWLTAVPHQPIVVEGVNVFPIKSTDLGVGFLVETDGVVVYHPGDHINKEAGLASAFTGEVDYLADLRKKVDIAFFPVAGCGFPDATIVKLGNLYAMSRLNPRWCCPMHAPEVACRTFANEVKQVDPSKNTFVARFPGDHFFCSGENPESSVGKE